MQMVTYTDESLCRGDATWRAGPMRARWECGVHPDMVAELDALAAASGADRLLVGHDSRGCYATVWRGDDAPRTCRGADLPGAVRAVLA